MNKYQKAMFGAYWFPVALFYVFLSMVLIFIAWPVKINEVAQYFLPFLATIFLSGYVLAPLLCLAYFGCTSIYQLWLVEKQLISRGVSVYATKFYSLAIQGKTMKTNMLAVLITALLVPAYVSAKDNHSSIHDQISDQTITHQRSELAKSTKNKGFGPQSPRDIASSAGNSHITFSTAPAFVQMNLCNIHFHKNAEHKGGEFTTYAGNGDGHGFESGYVYTGHLSAAALKPINNEACPSKHGSLEPGDTIEVHYVYSTAQVKPGPLWGRV